MLTCFDENGELQFEAICNSCYKILDLKGNAHLELVFVDSEEIKTLNKNTRNKDSVTDVLSFPFLSNPSTTIAFNKKNYPLDYDQDNGVFLGSIVICKEVATAQAQEFGHSIKRETDYLFVHGLLHLLGFDHECEEDKKTMREKEEKILMRNDK